jgi:hypothetical protein
MLTEKCNLIDSNGICRLMNQKAVENCHCPHYTPFEIPTCGLCGNPTLDRMLYVGSGNKCLYICHNCKNKTGTSAFCQKAERCLLREYDGPLPLMIMKTIQQGPVVAQMQVPNPEVISATCHFCGCWDGEGCAREWGVCDKYAAIL